LSGNNYPTNTAVYLYTNTVALRMATNTTYWIVALNSDNNSGSTYKWSTEPSTNLDTGSVWKLGVEKGSFNGGVWQPVKGSFSLFSITAVSADTSAPPKLSISNIALTYPADQFYYVLQENSNLATTNWFTVTNLILSGTVSNLAFYILPSTAPHMYYRLNLAP
jgi:hypothetical protein